MQNAHGQTVAVMHFGGKTLRGTEVCTVYTIDGLHEAGYSVVLIANNPDVITARLKQQPQSVLQSTFPEIMFKETLSLPLWRWFKKIYQLTQFLKAEKASLLLTSGGLPCQMGLPISKWLGIPIAVHLHHPASKRYFYFWMIPWANLIIAPSQHTRAVIHEKCSASAQIVYNGIDVEHAFFPVQRTHDLRKSLGISEDAIVIASVGALVPHKRVDLFLRAMALAAKKSPHTLHALVIGAGVERNHLEQLATELAIAPAVTFLEQVPEIPPFLQQVADIHILTSSEEGFGLSVVEAAACGLPNIVAASGALTEVVQNGIDGIHVLSAQPEAFADAILQLSENPALRERMGNAGRAQAVAKFSVAAYKHNMLQQLRRLLPPNN
jgi:glycosyltransferase involved in cell wall biosynthesis